MSGNRSQPDLKGKPPTHFAPANLYSINLRSARRAQRSNR